MLHNVYICLICLLMMLTATVCFNHSSGYQVFAVFNSSTELRLENCGYSRRSNAR